MFKKCHPAYGISIVCVIEQITAVGRITWAPLHWQPYLFKSIQTLCCYQLWSFPVHRHWIGLQILGDRELIHTKFFIMIFFSLLLSFHFLSPPCSSHIKFVFVLFYHPLVYFFRHFFNEFLSYSLFLILRDYLLLFLPNLSM